MCYFVELSIGYRTAYFVFPRSELFILCVKRNMSNFEPTKEHLRHALLLFYNQKKTAAESRRLLVETYGDFAPHINTFEMWFKRFKSGQFDVKDKERPGQPKKCKSIESS